MRGGERFPVPAQALFTLLICPLESTEQETGAALFIQTQQRIIQSRPSDPGAPSHLCERRASNGFTVQNHRRESWAKLSLSYQNKVRLMAGGGAGCLCRAPQVTSSSSR